MTSKSIFTKLSLAAAVAASLAACGGSDDDKHIPLSSECMPPTTLVSGSSQYRITTEASGRVGVRTDEDVLNEPVEFHGRMVLRNRSMQRTTFEAPADAVGRIFYQWHHTYFTWNADGSRTIYGSTYAENWDSDSDPEYYQAIHYDPPMLDKLFTPLKPGESFHSAVTGTVTTTEKGADPVKAILNSSTQTTYVNQELVAVPAGTLTGCRYTVDGGPNQLTTGWAQKDTGIRLRLNERGAAETLDAQLIYSTGYR